MSFGDDPRRTVSIEEAEALAAASEARGELRRDGPAPSAEAILRELGRDTDGRPIDGVETLPPHRASEAARRAMADGGVDGSGLVVVTSASDVYHKPADGSDGSDETAAEPACRTEQLAVQSGGRSGWWLVDIDAVGWREPCEHAGCWGDVDRSADSGHQASLLEADPDDLEALEADETASEAGSGD